MTQISGCNPVLVSSLVGGTTSWGSVLGLSGRPASCSNPDGMARRPNSDSNLACVMVDEPGSAVDLFESCIPAHVLSQRECDESISCFATSRNRRFACTDGTEGRLQRARIHSWVLLVLWRRLWSRILGCTMNVLLTQRECDNMD